MPNVELSVAFTRPLEADGLNRLKRFVRKQI